MNDGEKNNEKVKLRKKIDDLNKQISQLENNLNFINVSGIGFDAHIANLFASTKKRGFFSYIKLTLKELSYKAKKYKIKYDNIIEEFEGYAIVFANASQYGNDARIAPNAIVDDLSLIHI